MVGAIEHLTLQLMVRTNHKFPGYRARKIQKEAELTVSSSVAAVFHYFMHVHNDDPFSSHLPGEEEGGTIILY